MPASPSMPPTLRLRSSTLSVGLPKNLTRSNGSNTNKYLTYHFNFSYSESVYSTDLGILVRLTLGSGYEAHAFSMLRMGCITCATGHQSLTLQTTWRIIKFLVMMTAVIGTHHTRLLSAIRDRFEFFFPSDLNIIHELHALDIVADHSSPYCCLESKII